MTGLRIFSWGMLCCLVACTPLPNSSVNTSKTLQLNNRTYEPNVKSVALYASEAEPPFLEAFLNPALTKLVDGVPLRLEFDDLAEDYQNYMAKIIHCNADWTKSGLRDLEFLTDYNEVPITNWEYSSNTRLPYVHYRYTLPQVKLPGNYVVVVYRDGRQDDIILSHRFMVVEKRTNPTLALQRPQTLNERQTHQRLAVTLSYQGLDVANPQEQIKITLRKNRRWDMTLTPQPTQVQAANEQLVYDPFDASSQFAGGNEYRWFETRSINAPGQNVINIRVNTNRLDAYLVPEKSRGGLAHGRVPDLNGGFQPRIARQVGAAQGDYLYTHFLLESDSLAGRVYTVGEYNSWQRNGDSELTYDAEAGGYVGTQLLKQGWYNYLFYFDGYEKPSNPWELEGSHFDTENFYEVMVYYRPLGSIQDLLVGYETLRVNPF